MDITYHIFKKIYTKNGKKLHSWYYWYWNNSHTKQIQKACKGCKTKWEAEQYIAALLPETQCSPLIKDIAYRMYENDSECYYRRKQLGLSVKENTLKIKKMYRDYIIDEFGNCDIRKLTAPYILKYLLPIKRTASWKNQYINIFEEIFEEAVWKGIEVNPPKFQRFKKECTKKDVFTEIEIEKLFVPENFPDKASFLLLLLALSAGLRISEARAFTPEQLYPQESAILVNGFLDRFNDVRNVYNKHGSKENKKWRFALIPPQTCQLLMSYIWETGKKKDELLFTHLSHKRKPVKEFVETCYKMDYIEDIFHRAVNKAGINTTGRKLTMHSLRYTYVTKTRELYDIDMVRKMVGHTNYRMTEYYTRQELESNLKALAENNSKMQDFFSK